MEKEGVALGIALEKLMTEDRWCKKTLVEVSEIFNDKIKKWNVKCLNFFITLQLCYFF